MYVVKRVALLRLIIGTWKTLLGVAVVVVGITFVHVERFDLSLQVSMAVAAVGTAVSFFIAFFAAQAYDRWWEARKIWGEFVNDSRSWGRLVTTILPSVDPFENHPNDIPMSSIVRTIEINLLDLLGEKDLPPPVAVRLGANAQTSQDLDYVIFTSLTIGQLMALHAKLAAADC